MPQSTAIDFAVIKLSPVTILTIIPDFLHYAIAPGTEGLTGSLIPATPINIRLESNSSSLTCSASSLVIFNIL